MMMLLQVAIGNALNESGATGEIVKKKTMFRMVMGRYSLGGEDVLNGRWCQHVFGDGQVRF